MGHGVIVFEHRSLLYCFSVLRSHVENRLRDGITKLESLSEMHNQNPDVPIRRLTESFFYGQQCSQRPAYVGGIIRDVEQGREYADLAELISRTADSQPGIILRGLIRSGKTIAALKAFLDCLTLERAGTAQPLNVFVPAWLNTRTLDTPRYPESSIRSIYQLLDQELPTQVKAGQWLKYSPQLLVILDLDEVHFNRREELARFIAAFQMAQKEHKHRCIVLARSSWCNEAAVNVLLDHAPPCFAQYQVLPRSVENTRESLRSLSKLCQPMPEDPCFDKPDIRLAAIDRLLPQVPEDDRHVVPALLATLQPGEIGESRSLAAAYEQLIGGILDGECARGDIERAFRGLPFQRRLQKVRIALGRLAIRCLENGTQGLTWEEANAVLKSTTRDNPSWSVEGAQVQPRVYFDTQYEEHEIDAILACPLFIADGNCLCFFLRSLRDYLAASVLRYYQGPGLPGNLQKMGTGWPRHAVEWLTRSPEPWAGAARCLGALLCPPGNIGRPLRLAFAEELIKRARDQRSVINLLLEYLKGMHYGLENQERDAILTPIMRFLDDYSGRSDQTATDPYQLMISALADSARLSNTRSEDYECAWWLHKLDRPGQRRP